MSRGTRMLLLAAAAETIALPFLTAHVLVPQTVIAGHTHGAALTGGAGIALIGLLILIASVPLLRAGQALRAWAHARGALARSVRHGVPRRLRGVAYLRIADPAVSIFTAGLLRPRIFVTAGAESALSPGQLHAALLHERAHVRRRDPAWLGLIAALERAATVGRTGRVFAGVRLELERAADAEALREGAREQDLFEAIVASAGAPASGAGLSEAGVLQRLRWLAGEEPYAATPAPERQLGAVFGGLAVPPLIAHLLLWVGLICGICGSHLFG